MSAAPVSEPGSVVPESLPGLLEPESVGVAVELSVGEPVGDPVSVGVPVGVPDDVAVGDVPLGVEVGDTDWDTDGVLLVVGGLGTGVAVAAQLGVGVLEGYGPGDCGGLGEVRADAVWLVLLFFTNTSVRCAFQSATLAGRQCRVGVGAAVAEAPLFVATPDVLLLLAVAPGAFAELDTVLPGPAGVPSPSVPAPPVGCEPPVSTVLLAWMMACRNGWTPSETLAMIATPARTITGRSQLMAARPFETDGWPPGPL